jgi:peptidoglycan/xylan/chitin deacetylase (PgdA/CDA1 family)
MDGRDRVEDAVRTMARLHGRRFGNPQLTLRRYRMRRITVSGEISGQVLSVRFRPVGRATVGRDVALTFDDGPWPGQTRRIVRILRRHHAKATFFMVGSLVERYPALAQLVARAGMAVGNHSWDHPEFAELHDDEIGSQLEMTDDAFSDLAISTTLFRPPGGSYDGVVVREALERDMRLVNWSVDPRDWKPHATWREITRRVLGSVRPGSIVLLHDGGGSRRATVRALPRIIRGIRKMKLKLVAIPRSPRWRHLNTAVRGRPTTGLECSFRAVATAAPAQERLPWLLSPDGVAPLDRGPVE